MTSPDAIAEAAARKAQTAPKGQVKRWQTIARLARLAALTTNPDQRRGLLSQALEA